MLPKMAVLPRHPHCLALPASAPRALPSWAAGTSCAGKARSTPALPDPPAGPPSPPQCPAWSPHVPGHPSRPGFKLGTAPGRALGDTAQGRGMQALTAGPVGVVPPVNADALLGTEGRIGLQTGAFHARVGYKAAVEPAGLVVVLGGCQGVALGKQAVREGTDQALAGGTPCLNPPPTTSTCTAWRHPGRARAKRASIVAQG